MTVEVWIPLGSALLGAVVGGVASLGASVVIDRIRLSRDTRVRIYDEYLGRAVGEVARLVRLAEDGQIDVHSMEVIQALAQVRRAAVIAGRKDVRQIAHWQAAYSALSDLDTEIGALRWGSDGGVDQAQLKPLLKRVSENGYQTLWGLHAYSRWLEQRLAGRMAGPAHPSKEQP